MLLYPPRTPDEHGPISSVRWELLREGLEDYEYMHLADKLVRQLELNGTGQEAAPGRRALADAMALVDQWPTVRAANDEPYTLDFVAVADAIETMLHASRSLDTEAAF